MGFHKVVKYPTNRVFVYKEFQDKKNTRTETHQLASQRQLSKTKKMIQVVKRARKQEEQEQENSKVSTVSVH